MSSERGLFAFFDGSSSDFKKVLKPAGVIAGYQIKDITTSQVKLTAEGKEIELKVGMQMRREEAGEWQVSAQPTAYAEASRSTTAGSDGAAGGGADDDVLKRLMQKREQESNNEK